jgi:hypothetical protein
MRALIVAVVVIAGCAPARWTAGDTFVEAGVGLTLAADYLQTRQICADMQAGTNADWVRETNPVMGSHCQRVAPEIYFGIAAAAHVGAARLMPRWARRVFQVGTMLWQARAIDRNFTAGYSLRF